MANLAFDANDAAFIRRACDAVESPPSSSLHVEDDHTDTDDNNADVVALTDNLDRLKIESDQHRFFGKSSNFMLIKQALDLKKEYTGEDYSAGPVLGLKRREFWAPPPVSIGITWCPREQYSHPLL